MDRHQTVADPNPRISQKKEIRCLKTGSIPCKADPVAQKEFLDVPCCCGGDELNNEKNRERFDASPTRWLIPQDWKLDYSQRPQGKVIFIRRTTDDECLNDMGHRWHVKGSGPHKLVRVEVDLTKNKILFYRLRRREPKVHEFLGTAFYHFPNKPFEEN